MQIIFFAVIIAVIFHELGVDNSITSLILTALLTSFIVPPVGVAMWLWVGIRLLAR